MNANPDAKARSHVNPIAFVAMTRSLLRALAFGLALSGCALTGKADALSVRWFTPETNKPRLTSARSSTTTGPATMPTRDLEAGQPPSSSTSSQQQEQPKSLQLELGRVMSGSQLREKIAYRDAAYEVGYYDDKRWTERPELFVRRSLARTLFEEHHVVRRSLDGLAPVLDVEVLSFEEIRHPTPAARVRLRIVVHDGREALLEKTISVDRAPPPGTSGIEGIVHAMAEALDIAAEEVAKDTESVLVHLRQDQNQSEHPQNANESQNQNPPVPPPPPPVVPPAPR